MKTLVQARVRLPVRAHVHEMETTRGDRLGDRLGELLGRRHLRVPEAVQPRDVREVAPVGRREEPGERRRLGQTRQQMEDPATVVVDHDEDGIDALGVRTQQETVAVVQQREIAGERDELSVTKLNVDELNEIVELVYSLGVDELVFQVFLSDWGKDEMKSEADEKRLVLDSATNTKLESAKALAATLSLPFEIHRGNLLTKSKKCSWPWDSSFIASNGDVVPCCIIADSDTAKMGNVFETDFAEIWNGQPYQELRQRISDHDLPDYCKNCYGAE